MSSRLERRVAAVERISAPERRIRFVFQDTGETADIVQARIRAVIASGTLSRNDRIVIFRWKSPDEEEPGADGAAL
jgi:hypothetical protein